MNVIRCYAPTNDHNEDTKDQSYNRLQSIVEKYPTKELTVLMGDLNEKVGMDNSGYEDIMGERRCDKLRLLMFINSSLLKILWIR
ncbi:unnamed protein product [Schistosoma margrebowiei]|uniref:Uncharacterized protein n=1 Tax=Schistosoma margrebowiei TaxID=48269 RepID=A0A183MGY3_9TREM|nr:unnamed protein product [Schistosoma margrebowiei]